jgi:hypothetical protein
VRPRLSFRPSLRRSLAIGWFSALFTACGGTLDAGSDRTKEPLPVGPANPVILTNDGPSDNWHGEYAALLAHAGGPPLAGIVVSTGGMWLDLEANLGGWQDLVLRARGSGLTNVPDPIPSLGAPLERPSDGDLDATAPNDSDGARFIVETSARLSRPGLPVVVTTGGRLTDVADAYLIDPTVTERVVVVSSLGTGLSAGEELAHLGVPNGEMDPWAGAIVVQRFRYVQVSAYYDQLGDFPPERLAELPDNPFCDRIRSKQPEVFDIAVASDQVGVLALGLPDFALDVRRVSFAGFELDEPLLTPDARGAAWLVNASDGAAVAARIWSILLDPKTFAK